MTFRFTHLLLALALSAGATATQAGPYTVTVMDLAGADGVQGWDINNQGDFVGSATLNGVTVGYVRNGANSTILNGPAGALGAFALGISDGGTVVGSYFTVNGGFPNNGFVYNAGNYTTLSYPGAVGTQLRGISADGRYITGYANNADSSTTAFVYDSNSGQFKAIATGRSFTLAQGVTNAGLVMGHRRLTGPSRRVGTSYDLSTATLSDFSVPGSFNTNYRGINEAGLIDGWFVDANGSTHGFIGTAAVHELFDVVGATDTYLEGINDAGWLSGAFVDGAGVTHAFLARPVSEPAAWALLLAALGCVSAVRRRRACKMLGSGL